MKQEKTERAGEQGFMLLAAIIAIFLVLLALSVAAPKVAQALRRDREVETIHRGNEYVRAIQLYYRKFGHYPASMEALEKSNNIRFLRQQYVDPMTGKQDWRLIKMGEAKTTVKGFFGQPLSGLATSGAGASGLGSAAGMSSGIGIGQGGAGPAAGSPGQGIGGSSSGGFSLGGGPSFGSSPGSPTGTGAAGGASGGTGPDSSSGSSTGSGSGLSSQSATSFSGGGGMFVGVGLPKNGDSITVLNEQTSYQTWEFLYDPRIEQMKAKSALLGNGIGSTPGSSFGSGASTLGGFGTNSNGFGNGTSNSPNGTGAGGAGTSGTGTSGAGGSGSGSSTTNPQ